MPKVSEEKVRKFNDFNDLRRNLLNMTKKEVEEYALGQKSLREVLGSRFLEKGFRWSKREKRPKLR